MSPREVFWRLGNKCTDLKDAYAIRHGKFPTVQDAIGSENGQSFTPQFRLSLHSPDEDRHNCSQFNWSWAEHLLTKANLILENKLTYFHLQEHDHGDPIQWNRDHGSDIAAPLDLSMKIDYRDVQEAGDCKLVWEPNRHQHLVVLGRAYRVSGQRKYAEAVQEHFESWLDQCPYGYGMNWRSPMELSIRLVNWVWALDLTLESGIFNGEFRDRILHSVYLHLHDVTRKYSKGSSANNHLIGEAAGVFIATSYFSQLKNVKEWQKQSYEILCREIELQTFADGCNKELALEYQFFVLQFFLICGIVGKWCGKDFPQRYWDNLEKQLLFIGRLQEGGGSPIFYGDADDGYVLNLGDSHTDPRPLLGIGALLFHNSQLKAWAPEYSETLYWLFGASGYERFKAIDTFSVNKRIFSHQFPDSGFYMLQSGNRDCDDHISVLFDCGPLGFGAIAAHGHADALSFTLKAFNEDILVDPGTYDYFTYPELRRYFKSTIAHNTIEVDGVDQSVVLGLFLWGKRAESECLSWQPEQNGGLVKGQQNGYMRLKDPVLHYRTLHLDGDNRILRITDEIICKSKHTLRLPFHFAPNCILEQIDSTRYHFSGLNGSGSICLDPRVSIEIYKGNLNPPLGWCSNGYHRKQPSPTLLARVEINGNIKLSTSIILNDPLS
ncbi:heparinase II/III family protein [Desulfopila aestuarii]|nr:alginate lyase family protein [Desulfopila aestuarii]